MVRYIKCSDSNMKDQGSNSTTSLKKIKNCR